jgi:hypothetical protein
MLPGFLLEVLVLETMDVLVRDKLLQTCARGFKI